MLVIYVHFSDVDPEVSEEWVRGRFFDPGEAFFDPEFPSVAGWYDVNSFGQLTLYPAAETQGTQDDGVVVVDAGPFDSYYADPLTPWEERNRTVLGLADPYVDYAAFDSNADGVITDAELVVVNIRVARPGLVKKINGPVCPEPFPNDDCPNQCNDEACPSLDIGEVANRGVAATTLDGVTFANNVAMGSTAANFMTWVHEITHTTLHLLDLYAFPVGTFDIAGPTLDAPDRYADRNRKLFSACAWSKMHWGWITPTVVTQDGYYDVRLAYTTGDAFVLYDPDRGTNDYFIVENRRVLSGTNFTSYDRDIPDSGLVIWRVDETRFNPPAGSSGPEGGPITRRSPNSLEAAWDPADPDSPERTMTSPWRDGTANTLAVRAIGPAGDEIRAYFDVRGPGVLVDPYPLGGPYPVVAGATDEIPIPVMNTGEAEDSFEFTLTGLPADWTAVSYAVTLAPVTEDTANVDLTPAHDAPAGIHTLIATGASTTDTSVASGAAMEVEVFHEADLAVLDVTALDAPAEILAGESYAITVETRVTNGGPSWPTDATLELTSEAEPGGSITSAWAVEPVPWLELDEVRVLTHTIAVSCDTPGVRTYAVTAEIQPVNAEDVDPASENNTASSVMEIDCVMPVAINIKPHSYPNSIGTQSAGVVAVAVLTTEAGEYGLPLPFDAQWIDPLTVRFGPEGLVWPELGGASEAHDTGHLGDSYELDDTTRDRDVDMVLHFGTRDAGLQAGDVEACVKGEASDSGGQSYRFFGCDSVHITPD
jgi:M6 family metalloprotease-like protein